MEKDISSLFEEFVKQAKIEGKAPATIRNYRGNFELLKSFKPDLELKDLVPKTMVDFLTYQNERERKVGNQMVVRTLKNSSILTIMAKLTAFFNWLRENRYITEDPFKGIAYPNVDYTDKRAFPKEQLDKIYIAISRDTLWENTFLKRRNLAMIMFLTLTGVRKGEFLGLQLSDIDFKNKLITIRGETSKSKRTRIIPIHPALISYLEDYCEARAEYTTPYLWVSNNSDRNLSEDGLKHFITNLSKATGVNCHIHRFRHTFAMNYYRQTHDIVGLKKLLGHKSIKMTLSYLRSLTDEDLIQQMGKMVVAEFM